MALYVIADLHLSLGGSKPMDIFSGWENHVDRLKSNWTKLVKEDDIVVIPGDISWGLTLSEALPDFRFINSLPGKKIISKGNHDYWWQTRKKLNEFILTNNLDTISFMHNNSFETDKYILCGTRGWIFENGQEHDEKIIRREAARLKMSLDYIKSDKEKIVFLHYPAIYMDQKSENILNILKEYDIKKCYYGHLHSKTINYAFNGDYMGTFHRLISADSLNFCPYFIDN